MDANHADTRCVVLPFAIPIAIASGFALASSMRSLVDLAGSAGCVSSRNGAFDTSDTAAKSLTGSYARSGRNAGTKVSDVELAIKVYPSGAAFATMP